jgi:hypothetical protein
MYPFGVVLRVLPALREFPDSSLLYLPLGRTYSGHRYVPVRSDTAA